MKTATTLRAALAPSVLIEVIRAWAKGLRTIAMWSMPGSVMLSVQRVRPVMRRWSSLRRRALPSSAWPFPPATAGVSSVIVMTSFPHVGAGRDRRAGHRLGALLHGQDDVVVAGASTEVALQPLADLLLGGVRGCP